jgi:DNA-binding MarR family transcriptional regulator
MRSINRHVSLLFRMGERFLNHELAGSGVSSGTAPLLLELRDGENHTPAALAAAVGIDKAYVTRALRSLERAGYVAIVPTPADGRSVTVSLTAEGQAAAGRVESAMRAWVTIVSRGVSPVDLDTVNTVFDQFYVNAQEYFTRKEKNTESP